MRKVEERTANLSAIFQSIVETVGMDLRVAMPGIVQEWDKDTQTAKVQPAIQELVSNGNAVTQMNIPILVDVPVVMPRFGGYCLVGAPKPGDECLLVFSDMCIDAWWQSGGIQTQADSRRHDLSDAFAVMGCWSQTNKPVIPEEGISLQDDKGLAGISVKDGTVDIFGKFTVNGASFDSHRHSGVEAGSGSTGGVI